MAIGIVVIIFVFLVLIYVFYSSYSLQLFIKKRNLKKSVINEFVKSVKGEYIATGYFAQGHRFISTQEFKSFSNRHKLSFAVCYNVVTFRTPDAHFEFFFHMVKDGVKFSNIMNIRVFPKLNLIKSEGNVEKNYSRLNLYTNNRYLTALLETNDVQEQLKWILRGNGDILLISHNNLHYKIFISEKDLTAARLMEMIKSLNYVKNKVYKDGVLEY